MQCLGSHSELNTDKTSNWSEEKQPKTLKVKKQYFMPSKYEKYKGVVFQTVMVISYTHILHACKHVCAGDHPCRAGDNRPTIPMEGVGMVV